MSTKPHDIVSGREPCMDGSSGLTKREYFAALTLQGIVGDPNRDGNHAAYARDAVMFADALIAELNKGKA